MRRLIVAGMLVLVAALLWRVQPGGLNLGVSRGEGQDADAGSQSVQAGAATELRIEIVESAAQADARNDEILARYGNDPIARAWVADCMTQAAAGREDREEFSASWAYACWRSWGDQRESPELDTGD